MACEDLLGFLNDKLPEGDVERMVEEWKIDLKPQYVPNYLELCSAIALAI